MASGSAVSSSVNFPVTESPQRQGKASIPSRPPYLPFRRISLPTAPTLLHRDSVASVASFDSFPEGDEESPPTSWGGLAKGRAAKTRPFSVESPRRRNRFRDSIPKPPDNKLGLKRRKVVDEFYETEKAYVDGLELIYSHFLTPIIVSLDTPEPLLNRSALTSIFSNFIDIWNLHRSFLSSLTSLLKPIDIPSSPSSSTAPIGHIAPPKLSPLLLAHFPYLSLYNPFVTSFPATIAALTDFVTPPSATRPNPQYNYHFATFLAKQEADPRCGKLKLRDWLLTVVQRCPRYLLLLKDLINSTNKEDAEHAQLTAVHTLVSKITLSLNTSLHTHAQTLGLLALQKATPNLPFQLISPGRNLVKRGPLVQIERSHAPVEREFLLFSDCLIWLEAAEHTSGSWDWSWSGSGNSASGSGVSQSSHNTPVAASKQNLAASRPAMLRTRSKSEAELPTLKAIDIHAEEARVSPSTPATPIKLVHRRSHYLPAPPPPPNMAKRHPSAEDKWVYKGRVELVDLEVVFGSALEDERRLEVLSPEGSFALYAASEEERDQWTSEIRAAKAQLLISLNVTNPNSTLTSSASTNHVRRALQALPYPPSDDRLAILKGSASMDVVSSSPPPPLPSGRLGKFGGKKDKGKEKEKEKSKKRGISAERRLKVEHWVPAIWIPDGKTSSCMRCGRMFGWRRRRHHCRLCGRCVCGACSGRTFYIADTNSKDESGSKPARACDACYETVFPLIDPPEDPSAPGDESAGPTASDHQRHNSDTITSLSHLPSWLSMPALPVQRQPQALMAIDLNSGRNSSPDRDYFDDSGRVSDDKERKSRMRLKSHQRQKSYQQILEDFQEQARAAKQQTPADKGDEDEQNDKFEADDQDEEDLDAYYTTPTHSPMSSPRKQRREDTARRSKRFSLPAIALNTTSVTARTTEIGADTPVIPEVGVSGSGEAPSPARAKRFSLVLAGRNSHYSDGNGGGDVSGPSSAGISKHASEDAGDAGLGKGVAAAKLSELLRKSNLAS